MAPSAESKQSGSTVGDQPAAWTTAGSWNAAVARRTGAKSLLAARHRGGEQDGEG